jgi:outer membrane protein OmpA-like peptidoglycan-associated protein
VARDHPYTKKLVMQYLDALSTWRLTRRSIMCLAIALAISACAALSNKEKGAIIGAGTGGAVGAVIGNQTGSTTRGAIIGAVVGGVAGTIIGNQMDQQAKELKQNIPGATVARIGEGIQVTFASGLLYDFDSDVVRAVAAENLRNLAASLGKYPNTDLLIVGYTDSDGTSDYNLALSERRAMAVSSFLATQGVTVARLRTAGRGEMEPVSTNDSEVGRQLNRRVEVAIFANAGARAAHGN